MKASASDLSNCNRERVSLSLSLDFRQIVSIEKLYSKQHVQVEVELYLFTPTYHLLATSM